jgi:hypothetical protein
VPPSPRPAKPGASRFTAPTRARSASRVRRWTILLVPLGALATLIILTRFEVWAGDIRNISAAAAALVQGRPPTPTNLAMYPPTTYLVYTPLGLLAPAAIQFLTQFGCIASMAAVLWIWGQDGEGRRSPWILVLLLSPPMLETIFIDQFNAVVGLLSLSLLTVLLARHRAGPVAALLGVLTLVTRPFNAIPLLPALGRLFLDRRRLFGLLGMGALLLIGLAVITWRWDGRFVQDTIHATAGRPLTGLASFVRLRFGVPGVVALLGLCAVIEWTVVRLGHGRLASLDMAAILCALSLLPVQLGGLYTAVYALPVLIRLACRLSSPALLVATSAAYSLVFVAAWCLLDLVPHFPLTAPVVNLYVYAPLFLGVGGSVLLLAAPGADRRTLPDVEAIEVTAL